MKTRLELEENQMKRYQWEKDQMQHMKVSYHILYAESPNTFITYNIVLESAFEKFSPLVFALFWLVCTGMLWIL